MAFLVVQKWNIVHSIFVEHTNELFLYPVLMLISTEDYNDDYCKRRIFRGLNFRMAKFRGWMHPRKIDHLENFLKEHELDGTW